MTERKLVVSIYDFYDQVVEDERSVIDVITDIDVETQKLRNSSSDAEREEIYYKINELYAEREAMLQKRQSD